MSSSGFHQRLPVEKRRRFAVAPTTRLGKWAVGLALASFVLGMGWRLMGPVGGFPMIVVALASGVVALRRSSGTESERSRSSQRSCGSSWPRRCSWNF